MKFEVGQEVAVLDKRTRHGKEMKPGIVTKIGRKYLYVRCDNREIRFSNDEHMLFYLLSDEGGYIDGYELFPSVQAFHDFEESKSLRMEIRGIIEHRISIPLADLKKIREILQ